MPKETKWTCDNSKCKNTHLGTTRAPDGWRETLLMRDSATLMNGQAGTLCGQCADIVAAMLPPPLQETD